MSFTPRPYQLEAIDSAKVFFEDKKKYNAIQILPTGSGKSVVIANIAMQLPGKTIVFQPSKEILAQNYAKFISYGYRAGIYSASANKKFIDRITFATIGSVIKKKYLFNEVQHIIIDECHLVNANAGMYFEFIESLPNAKVLGLTATPYRLGAGYPDGAMLKFITRTRPKIFNKVIYHIQNKTLFDAGHLAKLEYFTKDIIDRSRLKTNTTGTDFTEQSLKEAYKDADMQGQTISVAHRLLAKRKNLLIFCTMISEAMQVTRGIPGAVIVTGETPAPERDKILSDFKSGKVRCCVNVGVLTCLSKETEVLTNRGWLTKDKVTLNDFVAQYDNGKITFEKPTHKHEHNHIGNMVSVDSSYVTFNVTDDHDMLVKTGVNLKFNKKKARDIVGKRLYIPVSGFCEPEKIIIEQKPLIKRGRFIAQNSYNYRKKGMNKIDAEIEALRQWDIKSNLKYKNPNELTLDECRFIGFWLGDGSVSKSVDGDYRYSLCQSFRTPKMITWIESILKECNINFTTKDYEGGENIILGNKCHTHGYRNYSLSKGTGGNNQNVVGLYSLIPYLIKKGTDIYKGLSREQYFALMEGLFKADGWHGDNKEYTGGKIVGEYKELFDLLQSIGVCRGYRVTIKPVKMRANNKKQLFNISLCDKTQHQLTNERAISAPANGCEVWCLTMSKGTLVTRNKGTVTIMGNTGFDYPELEATLIARSTMSLSLYYQMIGRVMRPHPNKVSSWVVDLGGNYNFFGKIETMEIRQCERGHYSIWQGEKQLTNVSFTKT